MLSWKKTIIDNSWLAFNEKNENVGCLKLERVGAHMHWCWYQTVDFYMSPGCLDAVRSKQKELFKDRKKV